MQVIFIICSPDHKWKRLVVDLPGDWHHNLLCEQQATAATYELLAQTDSKFKNCLIFVQDLEELPE